MYSFNIILTELCNAKCSHCYMADDRNIKKKTLTKEEIDVIINKMPPNTKKVVFTGGEIFLVYDLLMYAIDKVKEKDSKIEIGLESNGIYLYKSKNPLAILKELDEKEIKFIRFSDDPFHHTGGVDLEKVRSLKEYQKDINLTIDYLVQTKALALGRAKELSSEYHENKNCMNRKSTLTNPYLFLDINGNAYICTWKCLPAIGNLLKDDWSNIDRNLKSKFNQLILQGRIEEAFISLDKSKEVDYIKYSKKNGQCMLCDKMRHR